MLTLGLFEGIVLAAVLLFVFIAGTENDVPWHRVLGIVTLGLLGVIAFRIVDLGLELSPAALAGLAVGGVLFMAPVAVLAYAWRGSRAQHEEEAERFEAAIVALPRRDDADTRRAA